MTQAKRALDAVTPHLNRLSAVERRTNHTQVWLEVMPHAEGFDRQATAEADPSDTNEVAVFADGSRLWWNHSLQQWEVG